MNQAVILSFAYGCFIFSIALGIWLYRRLSTWEKLDQLMAATAPVVLVIWFELMFKQWLNQPHWPINGSRLVPTFALTNGYQLYYDAEHGSILSTIYGPLTALVYLPSTLASSPTNAILIASLIAVVCFFAPVLWLFIGQTWPSPQKILFAVYIFIGFCFFTLNSSILSYSAFRIHADAPAIGFSALSCGILYYRKRKDSISALFLSAVFAVMAVWTKQVTIPIIFALPIYVLLADGTKVLKRYVLCLVISGLVISAIFLAVFNPELVWFNLIRIPGSHPWTHDNKIFALLGATRKIMQQVLLPMIVIIYYVLYQILFLTKKAFKTWLDENRWVILGLVGLFMIPTSIMGSVKIGGDVNTFSFSLYFLSIAAGLIFIKSIVNLPTFPSESLNSAIKLLMTVIVIAVVFTEIPPSFPTLYRQLERVKDNSTEAAYYYSKHHPGLAYFPFYPLSTLMGEGKLYHFTHGLLDRKLAGVTVTPEHFRQILSTNLQFVGFSGSNTERDEYTTKYLPEFSRKIKIEELPKWTIYVKEKPLF